MIVYYAPAYAVPTIWTTWKSAHIAASLTARPIAGVTLTAPRSARPAALRLAHTAAYVEAVRTGHPAALASSNGFPWTPETWQGVTASTGGVMEAALTAVRQRQHTGSLSSGLHHADADEGAGFCTFNGLAVAALLLAQHGHRVLVLDVDAHCGGGTARILEARGSSAIVHADLSVCPFDDYVVNRPADSLELVTTGAAYVPRLEARLAALRQLPAFDVCLYNAGMDPYEADTVGGLSGITRAVLAAREQLVFAWARAWSLPIAFVLAGGYPGGEVTEAAVVALHRLTLTAAVQQPLAA
jgi:acetoin utilization deacetylase AcuC-like enzyme